MVSLRSFLTGSILAISALASSLEKRDVSPGPVKDDAFVDDPTVVEKPDDTYFAAFTANGVGLKKSTGCTTWKDICAVFSNGAAWTITYTKGDKDLLGPRFVLSQRSILYVLSSF
jgi:arabinan endo-1,5-alpha-L-arabinosidase